MSEIKRGPYALCVTIVIIMVSLLTGCAGGGIYANYSAIEDLQLVDTLAVDAAEDGVALTVTSAGSGEGSEPLVLGREGAGLLEAIDSLRDFTPRGELFFAHTQSIVLGEDYAAQGIGALLDFAERDVQLRLGTDLFVLRGARAADLAAAAAESGGGLGEVLTSVRRVVELRSDSSVGDLRQTAVALSEYGAALVCALAPAETEGSVFPADGGQTVVPAGYAVLRSGALAGYLSGGEAEAASILTGRASRLLRTVEGSAGGKVTLLCEPADTRFAVRWSAEGTPELEIEVRLAAVVTELGDTAERVTDPEALAQLGAEAAADVQRDLAAVLARSQALDADFLALGQRLRLDDGTRFAALGADWLPSLKWQVRAVCSVAHSYDLNDPIGTEGGGV